MKQFKLYFLALVALLCTVSFSVNAVINVGDTITMDGVVFKVPAAATNLITNPGFEAGMTGDWRSGIGDTLLPANFAVKDTGGVNNSKYLVSKVNGGSNNVASLRTLWPLQLGKGYLLSYYCLYTDTSKVTTLEPFLKVSQTNTAGTETLIQKDGSNAGGKGVWSLNQTAFTGKYNFVQIHFRWLSTTYGFDEFALIKLDSIGLDVTAITNAITNAQTYVASNYPGVGALNAAIAAAEAGKSTLTGPADITTIVNNLAAAIRAYKLSQAVAPGDSLDFTFAIVNPGIDAGNVQPNGWTVTKNTGNYTNNNEHYTNVTNSYLDSWNGTAGYLQYVATQTVTGLPKGTYRVSAASRTSGNGVYITGNNRQTEVIVNNNTGGTLGRGWNRINVDSVVNVGNSVTIGAKTTPGWTGWWFSADDFTLTYFGEIVADYQKNMAVVAASVRAIDLSTVPNGVDALITAALAKSDTASVNASVLEATSLLVAAQDSANLSMASYASLKALIVSASALDTTYAGLTTFRAAIAAANTLVGSATALRPNILAGITTLSKAMNTYQYTKPASAGSPADFTFAIANPSFELGNLNGWTTSTGASDNGAKLNSNATYTMSSVDGSYLFNIWGGSTLPFVIKQEITGLPKGTYKLIATVATDSLNVVTIFANGNSLNILPNNKGTGKTDTLGMIAVADGKLTIGAQSQTWFKADNFRLLFVPPVDMTSSIVNPTIEATSNSAMVNGWTITKGTGNSFTNTGQHYSGVGSNRYLDSWNGTAGSMIYTATQVVKSIPNGIYSVSAAARTSGLKSYIFANEGQTEIINMGGAGGTLGNGFNTIIVDKAVVMDSSITIGAKTVTGWTGTWFSADDFKLTYVGPADFTSYKTVLDNLIAKAQAFDVATSPDSLDAQLATAITAAQAATDVDGALAMYTALKKAYDANVASVTAFAKLKALIVSSTTLATTTTYDATAKTAFQAAITAADGVVMAASTGVAEVDAAIVALNQANYNYKVTQPAPADFSFVMANPDFEEGTTPGVDPTSIKKNGNFTTPKGWNAYCIIDTLASGANMVNISGSSVASGNNGYETWAPGGMIHAFKISQTVVAPSTGYYVLSGMLRCDGSSQSLTDPLKYDGHMFAKVGSAAVVSSMKLAEAPGLITGSGWNAKAAWRKLSVIFTATAGDTINLGAASTSFMQMDNFTLAYRGGNNPNIIDVAYITKVKAMDAAADTVINDPIYRMLSKDPNLNVVINPITDVSATATFDQSLYDVLVIQESFGSSDAILRPGSALGLSTLTVPTLYNKTYAMKAGRALASGAAGAGAEGTFNVRSIKVDSASQLNSLFKGITFVADTVQLFSALAQDNGASPHLTDSTKNKSLNVANAVIGTEGTLLGVPTGMTSPISVNKVMAPDTIGGQIINTNMILFGQNFGAICSDHGQNMTNANYTLWRNAVYILAGLEVPSTSLTIIPVDVTSLIVNPGINAASNSEQPNGWTVTKNTGNVTNVGQHYSGDGANRYLDSWNGTAGFLIYNAQQTINHIPNGIYSISSAARTSGSMSYIFANDKQTEIINNGGAGGTLGNGFSTIKVENVVVLDSSITIGAKTVTNWTGTWFSADDFTMNYFGPGDFVAYKSVLDSLIAKAKRFDLNTSPNGLDAMLATAITSAEAATDVNSVMSNYASLKMAYGNNMASVMSYTKLQALIASSTTLSNTTAFNGLTALKDAITAADVVANAATTMPINVDAAIVALNKALYDYKVTQPAPADFTFIMANPSFEEGFTDGVDPMSSKPAVGNAKTPIGWNVLANIDLTATAMNLNSTSGTSMADGNWGYETWCSNTKFISANVSQKIVAPATGYYVLSAMLRCDGSSPSATDPLLYDGHVYAQVGSAAAVNSIKLAEAPGFISGSGWNAKTAWRKLSLTLTANAGDTIKLGVASTSFMQMDNFTLSFRGANNPATNDVAYITFVKPMDVNADSVQNDPIYRMLSNDPNLNVTLKALTNVSATATIDQSLYDAIVIQESLNGSAAIFFPANALGLPKLSAPTLYNKTYVFKAGRGLVAPAAGSAAGAEATPGIYALKVDTVNQTNPLFRAIEYVADTVQMFTASSQDNGAAPTTLANSKALNIANGVSGVQGTLLAYPTGMTPSICVNDIPAGDTIGGQVTKTRIITFGMNFGAMCSNHGQNMTNANYTLWRNAVYSLVGLEIPNTPMNIVTEIAKPAITNDMNIVVYPNPTTSNINISNLNLNSTVKIYNMTGQQVFNGKANSNVMTVDMSRYNNGIYMLQVVSNGKTLKSKIIKK